MYITFNTRRLAIAIKSSILRPTVTVEHNNGGGSTYVVRHPGSNVEYVRLGWTRDDKLTEKLIRGFKKEFNKRAVAIETGKSRPEHIMTTMVDHGWFRKRNVLGDITNPM